MHQEPDVDVGFDPGSPGSRPGPKAGAKALRHPGIPLHCSSIGQGWSTLSQQSQELVARSTEPVREQFF